MAEKRTKSKGGAKKWLIYIVLLILIAVTIAEGKGYNPVEWLKSQIGGTTEKFDEKLTVNFIDVGQGDCILVSSSDENMLIDCGEASQAEAVENYLNDAGVLRLDYVIMTHPHSDHAGGMATIIRNYDVGEVIMPELADNDIPSTRYFEQFLDACEEKNLQITDAQLGRTIKLGDTSAEIIAPNSGDYSSVNNYSVAIMMTHGKNKFLFTGDAETLAENEMLNSRKLSHVDVYKAGHHGSDTSSSEEFLKVISPDYAVIMCGAGNSYGHPNDVVLERLLEYTNNIYRTDLNGNIIFESDGINLQVRTEK